MTAQPSIDVTHTAISDRRLRAEVLQVRAGDPGADPPRAGQETVVDGPAPGPRPA